MTLFNPSFSVCPFVDAVAFEKYKVPHLLYIGAHVYLKKTGKLFFVSGINDAGATYIVDVDNHAKFYSVKPEEVCRAYNVSELGIMLSTDFIMPINTIRGWAWTGNDGTIILKDKFYKTEAEARSKFILYFLELTIIELQDIIDSIDKNIKLLV